MTDLFSPEDLTRALVTVPGLYRAGSGRVHLRVRSASFEDAVRLVTDVAAVATELDHHPDIDLRWRTVTFTLSTHSAGGVTGLDVDLARRIRGLATAAGAEILPPRERVEVALDVTDADRVREFWRVGLGYVEQRSEDGSIDLCDPEGAGPVLWFQKMSPPRTERNRFHLDVYVPREEAEARVAATIAAGGHLISEAHAPDWWVLGDAEGNELCICTE